MDLEEHKALGMCAFASNPWEFFDSHKARAATVERSMVYRRNTTNPLLRNEFRAPFGELIVTRCSPMTARTDSQRGSAYVVITLSRGGTPPRAAVRAHRPPRRRASVRRRKAGARRAEQPASSASACESRFAAPAHRKLRRRKAAQAYAGAGVRFSRRRRIGGAAARGAGCGHSIL